MRLDLTREYNFLDLSRVVTDEGIEVVMVGLPACALGFST